MADDPRPVQDLDLMACFALYRASRAMTGRYRSELTRLGLTYPQYLVLLALCEESPRTVGDIGRRIMLDTGTLSPLLKRMATHDMVSRSRDVRDERVLHIHLTARGRELAETMSVLSDQITAELQMGDQELSSMLDAIHGVTSTFAGYEAPAAPEPGGGSDPQPF